MKKGCAAEIDIELAVMDLALGRSRGEPPRPEWEALRRHTEKCARCRELIEFYGTVHGVEVGGLLAGTGEAVHAKVLPLAPFRSPHAGGDGEVGSDRREFAMAAESERSGTRIPVEKSMTLTTEDGSYWVRIVEHADGKGAIAHIIARSARPGAAVVESTEVRLLFSGIEYAFDAAGKVYLPEFPGDGVALLVR